MNFFTFLVFFSLIQKNFARIKNIQLVDRLDGVQMPEKDMDEFDRFTQDFYFSDMWGLNPGQLQNLIKNGDVDFLTTLRDNMAKMLQNSESISLFCATDLIWYMDQLIKYTETSNKLLTCSKKQPFTSEQCEDCLNDNTREIQKNSWIAKFLDSAGWRPPTGLLEGNLWWIGDFSECVGVSVQRNGQPFNGQYCLAELSGYRKGADGCASKSFEWDTNNCNKIMALHLGICLPDSCSSDDGRQILRAALREMELNKNLSLCFCTDVTCHERELNMAHDPQAIIMMIVVCIIVAFMLFGSIYDWCTFQPVYKRLPDKLHSNQIFMANKEYSRVKMQLPVKTRSKYYEEQGWFVKTLLAFSMYTNGQKILDTNKRPGQLHCLHAIRFFSMAWVMFGHTYYWGIPVLSNLKGAYRLAAYILNQIIFNATFCVDAFFLLSGLLLTNLWLKDTHKNGSAQLKKPTYWLMFYVHRYIRLTPVYVLIMGIDVFLYRYITDGPMWDQNGLEPNYCRNSWWSNLLYVNNFLYPNEQCMSWTWYLANDMQFYVFSPLFLVLLYKFEKIGVALISLLILITGTIKGVITLHHDWPPTSLASVNPKAFEVESQYWHTIYVKPYCRCGPYLIGMLLGYIIFKTGIKEKKLPKIIVALGWTCSTVVNLALMLGLYNYSKTAELPPKPLNFLYAGFGRTIWAAGVGWVIFACVNGYGGVVNKFLSWKLWLPFSRLTYCAYLLHPLVIHGFYQSRSQPQYFDSHLRMTYYFFAHVLISYGSAFFLSMAFESPVLSIERLIFKSNRVSETSGLSTSKTGGNDFGQRNGEGFQKKANGTLSVGNFISSLRSKLT